MEYGFSILMFCFAGTLLLYAGLLAAEKRRPDLLIPRRVSVVPGRYVVRSLLTLTLFILSRLYTIKTIKIR